MAQTRISDIKTLTEAGVSAVFNRAAKAPINRYYEPIVIKKPEIKEYGHYMTISDITDAQVLVEGTTINYDSIKEKDETQIQTLTHAKGVEATYRALKFDLENVVRTTFGQRLINAMNSHKERTVAAVYNGAFTDTGADGVAIISDSHPLSNSVLLNDNLVTGALSTDGIKAAKNRFNFIYDQAGNPFDTMPTHLLIHPAKHFAALELLGSQLLAWELSNTKNSLQDIAPIKVLVNKYLSYTVATDVSPWFMLDKNLDAGCVLQTNGGLELNSWWENDTKNYRGTAIENYGCAFIAPGYGIVGSTGA